MSTDADQHVDREEYGRTKEEIVEERCLDHASGTVEDSEDEVEWIAEVDDPEGLVGVATSVGDAEDVDQEELDSQTHTRQT